MGPIDKARRWVNELREQASAIEEERRVPQALSDRLGADGFFRMLVPSSLGGGEVHPRIFAETLSTLAEGDGATGWLAMTGSTTGLLTAYLPLSGAQAVLAGPEHAALAGVFAPTGRASPEGEGYRLNGRWAFGSGCQNASWRVGGALVMDGDKPRTLPSGGPEIRSFFFRADESSVEDTWRTAGLRGTGSHHMSAQDILVPAERSTCLLADHPVHEGALYRFPVFGLLATGVASVGLGIARAALAVGLEMAKTKRSRGGGKLMGESEVVQVELATATGELRAAESFLHAALDRGWEQATAEKQRLSEEERANIRLAATHAARSAAAVTDRVYHLCGGASIWDSNPLSRYFRDVHVMTQHVMVSPATLKPIGRIALGLPTDSSML